MRDRRLVPYNVQLKDPSRRLRREPTPAERKLWFEFLRDLPQKFTRQKPLGQYIADFYCSRLRLVIEEMHDGARTAALAVVGLRVIRFTNTEVMQQFEAVCARIERELIET